MQEESVRYPLSRFRQYPPFLAVIAAVWGLVCIGNTRVRSAGRAGAGRTDCMVNRLLFSFSRRACGDGCQAHCASDERGASSRVLPVRRQGVFPAVAGQGMDARIGGARHAGFESGRAPFPVPCCCRRRTRVRSARQAGRPGWRHGDSAVVFVFSQGLR